MVEREDNKGRYSLRSLFLVLIVGILMGMLFAPRMGSLPACSPLAGMWRSRKTVPCLWKATTVGKSAARRTPTAGSRNAGTDYAISNSVNCSFGA